MDGHQSSLALGLLTILCSGRFLITTATGSGRDGKNLSEIWILGLFPFNGSWAGGLGQLPAVQMGLEDVNGDPTMLPGYRLRMSINDTLVSSPVAVCV